MLWPSAFLLLVCTLNFKQSFCPFQFQKAVVFFFFSGLLRERAFLSGFQIFVFSSLQRMEKIEEREREREGRVI